MREIDRRTFLTGLAASGVATSSGCAYFGKPKVDEDLTVFISDLHVSADYPEVAHSAEHLRRRVSEILAGNRLPKRVVIFGDIAYLYGKKADYLKMRPLLQPFRDLGIEIVFGLGNHDRRNPFYEVFPEEAGKTLVRGRHVVKVDLGTFDLLMLDSLDEPATDDRWISGGSLGKEQGEWLQAELSNATKPLLLCAHHPLPELKIGNRSLAGQMAETPRAFAFVHGHDHLWRKSIDSTWGSNRLLIRSLCLPSTGMWGLIGYATMVPTSAGCRIDLVERDAFFPVDTPDRSADMKKMLAEVRGQSCEFFFR